MTNTIERFCFLIHPRDSRGYKANDFGRFLGVKLRIGERLGILLMPSAFNKILPYLDSWVAEKLKDSKWLKPKRFFNWLLPLIDKVLTRMGFGVCSEFELNGTKGYIIAVFLTAEQFLVLPDSVKLRRIKAAILHAQNKLGVTRIGLGAYTAPLTANGLALVRDKAIKCKITHGDSLSAYSGFEAIKRCAEIRKLDLSQATIAIVGAYGLVGRAISLLLPKLALRKIILTGPKEHKLLKVCNELGFGNVQISTDNMAVAEADIVVLTTTAPGCIIKEGMLKDGAIVIDMAQPANMSQETYGLYTGHNILRIDGGYLSIPYRQDIRFDMGPGKTTSFGCFCETATLAICGDQEHHVGSVDPNFAEAIWKKAEAQGFRLASLTNFSEQIEKPDLLQEIRIAYRVRMKRGYIGNLAYQLRSLLF